MTGNRSREVAIVTGASGGIGVAICKRLIAREVFTVAVDVLPAPPDLDLAPLGGMFLSGDLRSPEFRWRCISEALTAGHQFKSAFLVNAAAISLELPDSEIETVWRDTLETNLTVPYLLCEQFRRGTQAIKTRAIVNILSLSAFVGFPGNPSYVASKAGLLGLTRALAVDYADIGVRVNAVAPGYVATKMTQKSYASPEANQLRRKHTLLGRWCQPNEIAAAVSFLLSEDSSYITGTELVVDGGWLSNGLVTP